MKLRNAEGFSKELRLSSQGAKKNVLPLSKREQDGKKMAEKRPVKKKKKKQPVEKQKALANDIASNSQSEEDITE